MNVSCELMAMRQIFYHSKLSIVDVVFRVYGQPGHGSLLLHDTAAEKLRILLGKIYDYRASQEKILDDNPEKTVGDITTLNGKS